MNHVAIERALRIAGAVLLLGVIAISVVGCMAVPEGSRAFRDGYAQGCPSGYADAGRDGAQHNYWKDETRFSADAEYRHGWAQGHQSCYEDERAHPRVIGGN